MSFRNRTTFSMVASHERQHVLRIPKLDCYRPRALRVLPVAAIYGGNASGKTNFFKALRFVQQLVVEGTQPDNLIRVDPFRLSHQSEHSPSRFSIELLVEGIIYEFSFSTTANQILEERLVEITSTKENVLYHRHDGKLSLVKSLKRLDIQFLEFAFRGTRDNQLFLTNAVSQKIENFTPIYKWFRDKLKLIAPGEVFGDIEQYIDESHYRYGMTNEFIAAFDTGICKAAGEDIPFEAISLPDFIKNKIMSEMKDGASVKIPLKRNRFIISKKNGELVAKKLITYHKDENGNDVRFEIYQESEGSQRLIDLLPAILELSEKNSEKVYIIDEIDRSLHNLLIRQLLCAYLDHCSEDSRVQLLLTTHDLLLMDQKLFRRDEMWVAERDASGVSSLISLSEYKDVRFDKDIRKSYLQGRFGGIPRLSFKGFSPSKNSESTEL